MRKILIILFILSVSLPAASAQPLSGFHNNYIVSGPSLTRGGGCDIKFQISLKVHPLNLGEHWKGYFAYTQTTVWDAYYISSPFHDISFMPGVYFDGNYGNNHIQAALEHRSNGRPFWGNPLRTEDHDTDDYSRGMNYLKITYRRTLGGSEFYGILKAGTGCGIGDYGRYSNPLSQDLYLHYLGYLTLGYRYETDKIGCSMEITPLISRSVLNAEANGWWKFSDKLPSLMIQAFYGYESLCDCFEGNKPSAHIRIGVKL